MGRSAFSAVFNVLNGHTLSGVPPQLPRNCKACSPLQTRTGGRGSQATYAPSAFRVHFPNHQHAKECAMQIRDVMTRDVMLADPGMKLNEAAALMRDGDFGLLPVGENDRLVGTITDRDIAIRAVAEGRDPNTTAVRDAMSEGIYYCFDDQTVEEAAEVMSEAQIRRLPIVNRDKRLVGIVALADLATEPRAGEPAGEALAGVSEE
jgi:CBS domain-containing protein